MSFKLVISGFNTKRQAEEFWKAYEGHFEQFFPDWFAEQKDLGCVTMYADVNVPTKLKNGNEIHVAVKIA